MRITSTPFAFSKPLPFIALLLRVALTIVKAETLNDPDELRTLAGKEMR